MHKSSILGAALISLAPAALADFQIYAATDNYPIDMGPGGISNDSGYIFVASEPSCDDINAVPLIGGNDDASNSGVRCEGEGCNDAGESTIDTFEWNTDMGHFTIYCTKRFACSHPAQLLIWLHSTWIRRHPG